MSVMRFGFARGFAGSAVALLLGASLLASAAALAGGVYKWVDENGKTHYGDRPPASTSSQSVKVKPSTSTGQAPLSEAERAARRRQLLFTFEAERAERANKRAQEKQALAKKREHRRRCAFARDDINQLKRASSIYNYDDQGNRRYLSDEQRDAYIKRYEAKVKKSCK